MLLICASNEGAISTEGEVGDIVFTFLTDKLGSLKIGAFGFVSLLINGLEGKL
jgi:hypothetical protein